MNLVGNAMAVCVLEMKKKKNKKKKNQKDVNVCMIIPNMEQHHVMQPGPTLVILVKICLVHMVGIVKDVVVLEMNHHVNVCMIIPNMEQRTVMQPGPTLDILVKICIINIVGIVKDVVVLEMNQKSQHLIQIHAKEFVINKLKEDVIVMKVVLITVIVVTIEICFVKNKVSAYG